MTDIWEVELIEAARAGRLPAYLAEHPETGNAALYAVISDLVYLRLTRPAELRRGHLLCAARPDRLEPDCHDRHQDDVEAVHADLIAHAHLTFANLRGWISSRLKPVTIDAHRRRRGERGALQRPRIPVWLVRQLVAEFGDEFGGQAEWPRQLALNVLEWVGVTATAGFGLWPLRAWVEQRARFVPNERTEFTEAMMAAEVEHVLRVMRTKPRWFADVVERPLGRKPLPLVPAQRDETDSAREPDYLRFTEPDDEAQALLTELAGAAIETIAARLADGAPARETVADVLGTVFGAGTGAEEMDHVPDGGRLGPRERAAHLLLDPEILDRVVAAVLQILGVDTLRPSGAE
ncbi:MAG TPA: hypothetical protein VL551_31580 [Actinospica sp.]|jgi:hypothetical protein|nr:hypothetical protein [Actinospica sp.]